MHPRELRFVAEACEAKLLTGSPQTVVERVGTDSRQVQRGDLFFALRGDRFDGHTFLAEVARKGAAAAVVQQPVDPVGFGACAILQVDDTRKALARLAGAERSSFTLPVVAVCGSNGKTTTKDLVASALNQKLSTLWSEASFNNDVGVPLTLLRLKPTHQAAVLEAGTNHPGELAPLLRLIAPGYGVLTNIGREHLEFFGDLAGVAQEEGCLAELLPPSGKLFVNGDNQWTPTIVKRASAPVVRVGWSDLNDWRVRACRMEKQGLSFVLDAPQPELAGEYRLRLIGAHQAVNAAFAVAVGAELGLTRAEIADGLAQCPPAKRRMEVWELAGVRVLDDVYNANTDSMLAALQTLQELPAKGRRIAVLGDMAELGAHSEVAHEEVGRRAAELGVDQLFAIGKMAAVMARGARGAGLHRVFEFADVEPAASAVKSFLKSGDVVLLKASRATRLERIGDCLRGLDPGSATSGGRNG
jgi:UDP-N-acetylmuramoyl-tripeptide--D-alanyl-D-alanine ligase